jgi:hypothetical protein
MSSLSPRPLAAGRAVAHKSQESIMLVRTALFIALSVGASGIAAADSATVGTSSFHLSGVQLTAAAPMQALRDPAPAAERSDNTANIVILTPRAGELGDVSAAKGPNPHASELAKLAVYDFTGNRDGFEMTSAQLRQFGVTADEVRDVLDHARLHDRGAGTSHMRESRMGAAEYEAAWRASQ